MAMTGKSDGGLLGRTRTFAANLTERSATLSKVLRGARKLLDGDSQSPDAITKWLEATGAVTKDWRAFEDLRRELADSWRQAGSAAFLELEAELRDLCAGRGWRIDGQWPEFVIEYGITVRLDEKHARAIVGDAACPANAAAIGKAASRLVGDLLPKDFSAQRFIESLLRAWEDATNRAGGQTPILDVYRCFVIQAQSTKFWRDATASLFTTVTTDQFRARLSRSLEKGVTGARGRELRLLPPLDPKDALFVYQPAERRFGYVGRIEFVESTGGRK
jgi:hypothetical protein